MKISKQFISTINKVSIVDYMESEYDSGFIFSKSSNWANTNCPMPKHADSSPSFGVNIENNFYNCFGCGCKGDIIQLVQLVEGLSFVESIQKISNFAGYEIELTNLDIKFLINEIQDTISSVISFDDEKKFPGRQTETNFMISFSNRTKKYLRNKDFNSDEINWVDSIYQNLDNHIQNNDMKQVEKIWNDFNKMTMERNKIVGQ